MPIERLSVVSSNTQEQKRRHRAHQYFRDLLKALREQGWCDWPYQGVTYRVIKDVSEQPWRALVRHPKRRGFKVTICQAYVKDSYWVLGPTNWRPRDSDILGEVVGLVYGPFRSIYDI